MSNGEVLESDWKNDSAGEGRSSAE
jgi:hypothetical protein